MKIGQYFLFLGIVFNSFVAIGQWQQLSVPTNASFRSLAVVSEQVVWAGGTGGTVLRTTNGGNTWEALQVKGAEQLDFRGIQAVDEQTAWAMSAGDAPKGQARIYKTTDGGQTWKLLFETIENGVFLDCLRMLNAKTGYVVGDGLQEQAYVLKTTDGGHTWQRLSPEKLPVIRKGEASFAASNSNIALHKKRVWIATQNRIMYSLNNGKKWQIAETPFKAGASEGIFGLYARSSKELIAVGGDYLNDKAAYLNVAVSGDAGKTWKFLPMSQPKGLKESVWQRADGAWIAVGTSGSGISTDQGMHWTELGTQPFHVVQCAGNTCFAVGGKGLVGKLIR